MTSAVNDEERWSAVSCRNWSRRPMSGSRLICRRSRGPGAQCRWRTSRSACCCAILSTMPPSWPIRPPMNTDCRCTRAWWRLWSKHSRYSATNTRTTRLVFYWLPAFCCVRFLFAWHDIMPLSQKQQKKNRNHYLLFLGRWNLEFNVFKNRWRPTILVSKVKLNIKSKLSSSGYLPTNWLRHVKCSFKQSCIWENCFA